MERCGVARAGSARVLRGLSTRAGQMMKVLLRFLLFALGLFLGTALANVPPDGLVEKRYCGPPARDANGVIIRSSTVIWYFRQANPCPSTGLKTGACPNWALNHEFP